ncbi:MAG: adenylyl-sulfate kinase [Pseudomonadota bacterium]
MASSEKKLNVVIVGHVDHGKSTLIGRLLHDTKSLEDGKFEELQEIAKKRNIPFEWSFVLDAFQAERDQAVTIDTTQIFFSSSKRQYAIIDAPGHREFLKNMISGAAQADAAVLVVDAEESVQEQTKRHAYMLSLLGISQLCVVVNKMDKVDYSEDTYKKIVGEIENYLKDLNLQPDIIIPACAREGEMIVEKSDNLSWYQGPTLIEALDSFSVQDSVSSDKLRFPIQDIYRFDEKRILVGRIETGQLKLGDTLLFSPTNEKAKVISIENWPHYESANLAKAGQSIGITLSERIFVERGHVGAHEDNLPMLSNVFRSNLFWLSDEPLKIGNSYKVCFGTIESNITVQSIDKVIDTGTLESINTNKVEKNNVAEVTFRSRDQLPIDAHTENNRMGRAVFYYKSNVVGGGLINMDGYADQRTNEQPKSDYIYKVSHAVTPEMRAKRFGYYGGIFWFTGLSGSGKSTLAVAAEKELFDRGFNAYVLDGDNVRYGLNADLGFSPEDRTENIRRVGEVAALQANSGVIVLSAFISPYQADREKARLASPQFFHEIHIKADLETCERRDPKGLYQKARAGEIKEFTGIDSPYEPPSDPDLIIDTMANDIETCVHQIVNYVLENVQAQSQSEKVIDIKEGKTIAG